MDSVRLRVGCWFERRPSGSVKGLLADVGSGSASTSGLGDAMLVWSGYSRTASCGAVGLVSLLVGAVSCGKDTADAGAVAASASASVPMQPQLPSPYSALRLGADRDTIRRAYPPVEDTAHCAPKLAGGDKEGPIVPDGSEKKPRSYCVRSLEIAGLTDAEVNRLQSEASELESDSLAAKNVTAALIYATAQVRGSVRAMTIDESLVRGAGGSSEKGSGAVLDVGGKLYQGSARFLRPRTARRVVCAAVSTDCSGVDADRVRGYVRGEYSLGTIDSEAHKRVANSKCRGPYVRGEAAFKRSFAAATGGLAGIGLARAAQKTRTLDPENPATFKIYSGRSRLDSSVAVLGVKIANALEKTEAFWTGAVALAPGGEPGPWGTTVVWFEGDKVSRILVNIRDEKTLLELPDLLTKLYGAPGRAEGSKTRWSLDGATAVLDIGMAANLVVAATSVPATAATQ